ncbi:MAG: flagellar biosynthesis protein FlhF [Planctomycetota bacterium]
MQIKTFRAKTMQQALDQVRSELGPEATVLHTRELNTGLVSWLFRGREIEVAASCTTSAPAQQPRAAAAQAYATAAGQGVETDFSPVAMAEPNADLEIELPVKAEQPAGLRIAPEYDVPVEQEPDLFGVYADLVEAELDEQHAAALVERLGSSGHLTPATIQERLVDVLADELPAAGPIRTGDRRCVAALVGPTGVGKTTTIAKLAANFRLREGLSVGLITVDTYRIAAVEQLRTYADIIELPMEVVASPREMREALDRMQDLDLVLMDTAGRSPKDEVRIQELKALLAEAEPDEVHLVLSATASLRGLKTTAERFSSVGVSSLLMTKLDEATGLGQIAGLTAASGLPISYLTDGQNVPDDIEAAESRALAQRILQVND